MHGLKVQMLKPKSNSADFWISTKNDEDAQSAKLTFDLFKLTPREEIKEKIN